MNGLIAMKRPTRLLIDLLAKGKPGDVITDAQLTAECGESCIVGGKAYTALLSAIRHCTMNKGVVWRRQRKEGSILCLKPLQIGDVVDTRRRAAARSMRRGLHELNAIDYETLPAEHKPALNAKAAQLATILYAADTSLGKKLEARRASEPINLKALLDAIP